jgi:hypothetical protein
VSTTTGTYETAPEPWRPRANITVKPAASDAGFSSDTPAATVATATAATATLAAAGRRRYGSVASPNSGANATAAPSPARKTAAHPAATTATASSVRVTTDRP